MPGSPLRILIAEDESVTALGLEQDLRSLGHTVVGIAADGASAVSMARTMGPDLVLLDVRLPDMDGFQVADRLAAGGSSAAVVVTSSSDDPLYPERAMSSGARGFVAKHDVCGPALDRLLS